VGSPPALPGWYGKLPGLGDFAGRRLNAEFVRPWDAWLQEVLSASRAVFGEHWLDCYLTAPIWRFVLLPGLVGPAGWGGVLMPSVDRVGRQFPLTIAVALPSHAAAAHAVFERADWFEQLESVALATLDVARGPEDLDRALEDCAFVAPETTALDGAVGHLRRLPSDEAFGRSARAAAFGAWGAHAGFAGLWWTRGRAHGDPLMLACAALPTADEFGRLLRAG
jgi:type VI secretion system protein ImpM